MITINFELFNDQYNGVVKSNMDEDLKEGLLNLLASIEFELKHEGKVYLATDWE